MTIHTLVFDIGGVLFEPSMDPAQPFVPIQEGINLLEECASYDLYICTNYASEVVEFLINEYPAHFEPVKGFITPDRAGAKKPHPELFTYLLEQYPIVPQEAVFIDDTLRNIQAAEHAGFIGIHATEMALVRNQLRSLGLLA